MLKHVDGKLIPVPDDDSVTAQLAAMRVGINAFLQAISADTPQNRRTREQYRTGRLSDSDGFDWFMDPVT